PRTRAGAGGGPRRRRGSRRPGFVRDLPPADPRSDPPDDGGRLPAKRLAARAPLGAGGRGARPPGVAADPVPVRRSLAGRWGLDARLILTFAFAVPGLAALGLDAAATDRRGLLWVSIGTAAAMAILLAVEWRPMMAWGLSPQFVATRSVLVLAPLVLLIGM